MKDIERERLRCVWKAMRNRCNNPDNPSYPNYGGRGIKVCARWNESFAAFLEDVGPRPPGAFMDRIDNNGDYEPENFRWASRALSNENRRKTIFVQDGTRSVMLSAYCREKGLNYPTVVSRLRDGCSLERALDPTPRARPGVLSGQDYENIRRRCSDSAESQTQIAKEYGVHQSLICRIAAGKRERKRA